LSDPSPDLERTAEEAASALTEPDIGGEGLGQTVARGIGMAGIGYVAAQILTLVFYLVLARLISPHEFGLFAAASLLVAVGGLFTESGMMAALIHRRDRIEEAAATAVLATAASGAFFSLLALAAAPILGSFFGHGDITSMAAVLAGVMFIRALVVVPEALLQRRFSFLRRMVIQPVGVIALGVSAIVAAANGLGPWSLVIGYYASAITDLVLSWALARWRPNFRLASFGMWRELVAYGRHVLASVVVLNISGQLPVVLLGRFVGSGALGQYRYAERMSSTSLLVVIESASYVLFPALTRINDDRRRFLAASMRSLRLMCAVAFPLGAILIPLGVPLATIVFGEPWRESGYATMALIGVPIGGAVIAFATEVVKADGHPEVLVRLQGVVLGATVVAMVALLPLGLVGVAAGNSIGSCVGAVYALRKMSSLLDTSAADLLREIWPPGLAALVMAAVLVPVEFLVIDASSLGTIAGLLLIGAEGIVGALLFLLALWMVAPRTAAELVALLRGVVLRLLRYAVPARTASSRST
jgi:PST family polysaccharide transporter